MNRLKVSVIMPAYNAAKYIREAINSLITQTFSNWELIVVDDCSTDNTPNIISDYQIQYSNILYVKLEENSGACYKPREEACKYASGDFILFLDSDDYLEKDYIEKLVKRQNDTAADAVLGTMTLVTENGVLTGKTIPNREFDTSLIYSGTDAFKLTIPWRISLNGSAFRKHAFQQALIQHEYCFKGVYGDELCNRRCLLNSDKVAFSGGIYYYRLNPNSLVHHFSPRIFHIYEAYNDVRELVQTLFPNDIDLIQRAESYMESGFKYAFNKYLDGRNSLNKTERKEYMNRFKEWYALIEWEKLPPPPRMLSGLFERNGFMMFYHAHLIQHILQGLKKDQL